jgi:nifR3 family TIM-barrel protein
LLNPIKIKNIEIKNPVILAPQAGITDLPFRNLVSSFGGTDFSTSLTVSEMVPSASQVYLLNRKKGNDKIKRLYEHYDSNSLTSVQIFGNDPFVMAESAKINEELGADIIDINMGCPVPKVAISAQAGSALLKDPDKVYEIVKAIVDVVPIPVTVKIRSGWDSDSINAVEIAKIVEKAGASAITVHPRTRAQGYSGNADWNIIKQVKEEVSIPVIGNGDIKSCYDAKRMMDETGCDAIMIGRGVLGNPWLIKECIDYLEKGIEPKEVSIDERIDMIKKHAELLVKTKSEKVAMLEMRTHAAYYIKGLPNSTDMKNKIFQMKTKEELFSLLDEYMKSLEN